MPAWAAASFAAALLQMAQAITSDIVHKPQTPGSGDGQHQGGASFAGLTPAEDALLEGCCLVQAAVCHHLAAEEQQQQSPTQRQIQQQQQAQSTSEHHHRLQQQQQEEQVEQDSSKRSQSDTAALLRTALAQLRGVLAASKHGKLTGTAASSLGSIINSALTAQLSESRSPPGSAATAKQYVGATAQRAQHGAPVGSNEFDLKGGMSDLLAAGDQVAKLPGAALGKQGVGRGLSILLGGYAGPHGNLTGSGLLSRSGWPKETDLAIQVRAVIHSHLDDENHSA